MSLCVQRNCLPSHGSHNAAAFVGARDGLTGVIIGVSQTPWQSESGGAAARRLRPGLRSPAAAGGIDGPFAGGVAAAAGCGTAALLAGPGGTMAPSASGGSRQAAPGRQTLSVAGPRAASSRAPRPLRFQPYPKTTRSRAALTSDVERDGKQLSPLLPSPPGPPSPFSCPSVIGCCRSTFDPQRHPIPPALSAASMCSALGLGFVHFQPVL